MRKEAFKKLAVGLPLVAILLSGAWVDAAKVGQTLQNLTLKNGENKPVKIPHFGKKVLYIVYADTQTADDNDPLSDALRAKKFDQKRYTGMGIANMKDSWQPDFVIRMVIRRKIKQYNRTILADDNGTVPAKWKLGNCDDKSVVMVIGKDKKLKYLKKGKVRGAEIEKVVQIIEAELARP
jgi:predicted transcriptional regulator